MPTEESEENFQAIPKTSSNNLNRMLQQSDDDFNIAMETLNKDTFDILSPESDKLAIQQDNSEMIKYLKMRAGTALQQDINLHVEMIKNRLKEENQFGFTDYNDPKTKEVHDLFIKHLNNMHKDNETENKK
ncbi:MAG: hypothetical protein KC414_12035 [Romboutsia sp.]|nr:hypothetical protein [Romboutsia sp.]